jgi:hypothetical protein
VQDVGAVDRIPNGFTENDVKKLLERQAAWQKGRKSIPWPEKIRMVEAIRESILQIRSTGPGLTRETTVSERTPRS